MVTQTKIFNGNVHPRRGGFRTIVTNNAAVPIPVLHGVYSGPIGRRCSVQVKPFPTDLIFTVIWGDNLNTPEFKVSRCDRVGHAVKVTGEEHAELYSLLIETNQWADNWLRPVPKGKSFLPCFAESEYRVHVDKLRQLTEFFSKFSIPFASPPSDPAYSDDWLRSPKGSVNLRPRQIDFDTETYIPGQYHNVTDGKCVHRKQHFYTIHGKYNQCQVVDMDWLDTVLDIRRMEVRHTDGNPLEQGLPAKWDLLIKIVEHAHVDTKGRGYGFSVDVWSPVRA